MNQYIVNKVKNKYILFIVLFSILIVAVVFSFKFSRFLKKVEIEKAYIPWPNGKRAAVSLTFDDARKSQVEIGVPLLNEYGVKATFYVTPSNVEKHLEIWKQAIADGHEIGNHTLTHPCSGNFPFSRSNALEDYTTEKIESEMEMANNAIERLLDVKPVSFAYPCGESFVGRGKERHSYVPVVAEKFSTGRSWHDFLINDPLFSDTARLMGISMDNKDFSQIRYYLDTALKQSGWLILVGHEINKNGKSGTTKTSMLIDLIEYANDSDTRLWIAPVKEVANHVIIQRLKENTMKKKIKKLIKKVFRRLRFDISKYNPTENERTFVSLKPENHCQGNMPLS